jgi:tektin-1
MIISCTDQTLQNIITDLINQKNITDEAFKSRIKETKEAKEKLELQHSEVNFTKSNFT